MIGETKYYLEEANGQQELPILVKYNVGGEIFRYDFNLHQWILDYGMCQILLGRIQAIPISFDQVQNYISTITK